MTNSGNISEILFKVEHAALKDAIKSLWDDYSSEIGLRQRFEEIKFFAKTLENFIRSPLGIDILMLLRITGYQIVLASTIENNKEKLWAITGKGPAIVHTYADGSREEDIFYIRYPFELVEFVEQVLVVSRQNTSEMMEAIVNSTNQIIMTINRK